jgi:hypothetical protein
MTIAIELPGAAIETLDGKTSDGPVPHLRLEATMRLYALQRLSSRVSAESVGNGRVEFLARLVKFGTRFSEQSTGDLALARPRLRSILA